MPTRYIVHGIDETTGTQTQKVIEAETAAQAEAIASKIGVKVMGSEVAPEQTRMDRSRREPVQGQIDQATEANEWQGHPSLVTNFWWYLSCIFIVTIPYVIYQHLKVKHTKYILTSQRLRLETGILSKNIEEIELYRILDTAVEQDFLDRILGIGTVTINSSDERQPVMRLLHIAQPREVREKFRQLSEARRRWRKVQEIEIQQ
jgi:membrane protein YdbS with pleckstrin-like domain